MYSTPEALLRFVLERWSLENKHWIIDTQLLQYTRGLEDQSVRTASPLKLMRRGGLVRVTDRVQISAKLCLLGGLKRHLTTALTDSS